MPSLVPADKKILSLMREFKIDFVALSFCRSEKDIKYLRTELKKHNSSAKIVAKIESQQALDNLDEIISSADAVMVARGDLGIEIPFEKLAKSQAEIIDRCRIKGKPVIVATQMLESMTVNPRPTRAEATDVANAVFDGTDAVMLSGETASGKYPVKAVEAMARIVTYNENSFPEYNPEIAANSDTQLVIDAAMNIVRRDHGPEIDVIIIFTQSGYTAQMLSRYRPHVDILAVTEDTAVARLMNMVYGTTGVVTKFPEGKFSFSEDIVKFLKKEKMVKRGQTALVIHGEHWRVEGQTNALMIIHLS
jgi:pyruvate kinase